MSVLPKRKRRRTYLAASARRQQILDVAKDVFSRRTYHAANIADICEAANIGRGTLYQYFDNKRDLLLALMESIADRVRAALASRPNVADIEGAARARVGEIVAFNKARLTRMIDTIFVDEATIRLIVREGRGQDPDVDRVIAAIDRLLLEALEGDLRSAQRLGILRPGDPAMIAQLFLGGIERIIFTTLETDAPFDRAALVQQIVDVQLFGILDLHRRTGETP